MSNKGIVTKVSKQNFQDTYEKIKSVITNNPNLNILLELDHQANAASVDLKLSPTKIILFGNPRLGTPLMLTGTFTGLDLPQKILVSERNGVVSISYNDPVYLEERHDIVGQEEVIMKISQALSKIADAAMNT